MPIISVRISGEEKKELEEYGPLSSAVREGVKLYLQSKKTSKAHAKLRGLQAKNHAKTTAREELKLIREDRNR
jgi:Arc/MetJ-type ribon-helix-helix transcriptional regulator